MFSEIIVGPVPWNVHPENPNNPVPPVSSDIDVCNPLDFKLLSRVGTGSQNGIVYEAKILRTNYRFALKFMDMEHIKEGELAKRMGEHNPTHFPRVIDWNVCEHFVVQQQNDLNSKRFLERIQTEFFKKYIFENMKGSPIQKKKTRIQLIKSNTQGEEMLAYAKNIGVENEILDFLRQYSGVPMVVMASELMSGDLRSFISENPKSEEIPRLIAEVFVCLRSMVRLNIAHNDLHLGNVLIRYSEGKYSSVIHDFGESVEDSPPGDHFKDIYKFLKDLLITLPRFYQNVLLTARYLVDDMAEVYTHTGGASHDGVLELLRDLERMFIYL